jgi:hypothetical protein
MRKQIDDEILDQEIRVEEYRQIKKPKVSAFQIWNNNEEEKKGD